MSAPMRYTIIEDDVPQNPQTAPTPEPQTAPTPEPQTASTPQPDSIETIFRKYIA